MNPSTKGTFIYYSSLLFTGTLSPFEYIYHSLGFVSGFGSYLGSAVLAHPRPGAAAGETAFRQLWNIPSAARRWNILEL
jgi:hypothetical protein